MNAFYITCISNTAGENYCGNKVSPLIQRMIWEQQSNSSCKLYCLCQDEFELTGRISLKANRTVISIFIKMKYQVKYTHQEWLKTETQVLCLEVLYSLNIIKIINQVTGFTFVVSQRLYKQQNLCVQFFFHTKRDILIF